MTIQTLGQYEIAELIGEGGMATVYRARQPRLERDVAVKVMLPELAADATFRERFEREARAIANLRHPNILTVYDYGETDDGQLYLVVDYLRGGTLRERLEASPGPLQGMEEALEIVAQVAEALDYAHQRGVIHRDVKPNNILLTQDGRPLLADFGLAKPIQSDRRLTASGVMLGTPDYVAPEQARGLEIDARADVYALGVMLFEMLTGRHPYEGETPISIIIKHVSEPMPRPSEINPAVPPALNEIVAQATAKSPDERYQRAGDMARALRATLVTPSESDALDTRSPTPSQTPVPLAPAATPTPPPQPVAPRLSPLAKTRVWVGVGVLLALAVAAALVLFALPSQEAEQEAAAAVPTAWPGEVMILIARFKAQEGSEHYDVSQRIYNKLSDDLRPLAGAGVTAYQVPDVVESSEAALELGRRYGATLVIWGFYDDIGISPNIETLGTMDSVGLERFNLESTEAADFKLYIAQDLPQELSFLTALSLVQTFMLRGNLSGTMAFLLMAGENLPADPQFRSSGEMVDFIQGMIALFQGDLEGAAEQIDQAIAADPDKTLFHTMRALVHLQMGEIELTMSDLERAIALEPSNGLAYMLLGAVAWMADDLEAAAEAFDQLIELDPDLEESHVLRAIIAFEMGDLTRAQDIWDQAVAAEPENGFALLARGLVHEKRGQSEQAVADYAQALRAGVQPNSVIEMVVGISGEHIPPYAHLFACTVYQAGEETEQALASCDQALEFYPAYFDALWKRGQIYAARGELETAIADHTAAIEADPRWPWAYYLRAQALAALGRGDEARADLAQALELDPVDELRQQIEDFDATLGGRDG